MNLLTALRWRYATKKFDSKKKVSEADLQKLLEAAQLSASSFGLQPYKILVVRDEEIRQQLVEHSWGQQQVVDASHLLVICNQLAYSPELVDSYLDVTIRVRGIDPKEASSYGDFMKSTLSKNKTEAFTQWTAKQAYIMLGNILAACGELQIDSTPMEGFVAEEYDRILGLKEQGLTTAVVLPIGYRAEEDYMQSLPKVRRDLSELVQEV